ncbi:hypothetical protein DL93DRAFT_2217568 [Clavulina sp. PMI_390]|nr:hypothetical protein DL93DRAFT_2217568 [Clavulina sp. PMI_390]
MPQKGTACWRCRNSKLKCDSLRPSCSRCKTIESKCEYPLVTTNRRQRTTEVLEARLMELEMVAHRLTLPSTHNLSLASARLLERIGRLGDLARPVQSVDVADLSVQPRGPDQQESEADPGGGDVWGNVNSLRDIQRIAEQQLRSYDSAELEELEELPLSLSTHLYAFRLIYTSPTTQFAYEDRWSPISQETMLIAQDGKVLVTAKESWRLELYLKVLVVNTFERTIKFARFVAANGYYGQEQEYLAIETQLRVQHASLPRLGGDESPSAFNHSIVLGHMTLYGSGLILHSLWAAHNPESRPKRLECLEALVDICAQARKHKHPHLGLVNIVHMLNAVRFIACELQRPEAKENAILTASYLEYIEILLDFLDNTMLFFPGWVGLLLELKDTLTVAAMSLST